MDEDFKSEIRRRLDRIDGDHGHLGKIDERVSKLETKTNIATGFGAIAVFVLGEGFTRINAWLGVK